MDQKIFTTRVRTNLNGVLQMTQTIEGIMMTGDNAANQLIVELYDGTGKVNIVDAAGTRIYGYFIRGDGYTIEVPGEIEDGNAKVIIPEIVYAVSGTLQMAVRLFEGPHEVVEEGITHIIWDTKMCIAALSCYIQTSETNSLIDPTHHIPDVQELLAYIDTLNQEREDIADEEALRVLAEQARATAETAREAAETARDTAETARETAEATREAAETARETAETTRGTAEAARVSAEAARVTAETGRVSAESGRVASESARVQAEITRNALIDGLDVEATKTAVYSDPTVTISRVNGHYHIAFGIVPGDPFVIAKTFASISAMESYTGTDLRVGQFVLIASTVEDPDNAKMYVVTAAKPDSQANEFTFVTDLSGAQGIKGDKGDKGDTGNGISSATIDSNYCLNVTYTDGTTYQSSSLQGPQGIQGVQGATGAKGDKGDKGDTGVSISSVVLNQDYTITVNFTDGTNWTSSNSIRGATGAKGDTGSTPDFDIGTVTTGAPGSQASASITGTAEEPLLNLTIPQGAKGIDGIVSEAFVVLDQVTNVSGPYSHTTMDNRITADCVTTGIKISNPSAFHAPIDLTCVNGGVLLECADVDGTSNVTVGVARDSDGPINLPPVTSSDNGKFLRVVNGVWAAVEVPSASGVSF